MSGCVYIVRALTTDYYKIGITTSLENRLHGLQLTVPFFEIELVATHYHEKYNVIESRLHKIYADKRLKNSEWFELTSADLSTATMSTDDLVDRLGLYRPRIGLHEMFPPKEDEPEDVVCDAIEQVSVEPVVVPSVKKKYTGPQTIEICEECAERFSRRSE